MYKKLIRDIQTAANNTVLPLEFLVDLSAEYNEACEAVNERMTKIVGLLTEGYRDEAIQIAEQAPAISDLLTQLDFPERWDWIELLSAQSLEIPPALMLEAASQLEQAYDDVRRLEPLLKRNRLLALSQAPLRARIITLQQLCKHDPTNPIWLEDIELLQRSRIVEIKEEFRIARSKDQTGVLTELRKELQQKWEIPIPNSLLENLEGASQQLERDDARLKMASVAERLNRSLLEYDADTGRQLRQNWNQLNQIAKLTPDGELALSAQESLGWLAELDSEEAADRDYQIAIANLEEAVTEQADIEDLDRTIYAAQKFEREIPESLVHRVNNYRDSLEFSNRRKSLLRNGLIAATLLILIAGISWFMITLSQKNQLSDAKEQMEQFVADDGFQPGQNYFEGLPERIQSDAEMIRLRDKLVSNETAETDRLNRISELFQLVDLDGPIGRELDEHVSQLNKLAVTDSEKKKVKTLKNNLESKRYQRQSKRDESFINTISPWRERIGEIVQLAPGPSTINELKSLIAKISVALDDSSHRVDGLSGISGTTSQSAKGLISRANAKIREIEQSNKAASDLSQLKTSLSNERRFARSLTEFANRHPDEPSSPGFLESAKEVATQNSFEKWQRFASTIRQTNFQLVDPEAATKLLEDLSSMKETQTVEQLDLDAFETFLTKKQHFGGLADEKTRISAILGQASYISLNAMYRNDNVFFLEGEVGEKTRGIKRIGPDATTVSTRRKEQDEFGLAVHCQMATQIRASVAEILQANLENKTVELIDLAVNYSHEGRTPEPVAHLEILNIVMGFVKATSPTYGEFAARKSEAWKVAGLLGSDWKCTDAERVEQIRPAIIQELAQLKEELTQLAELKTTFDNNLESMLAWTEVADFKVAGFIYQIGNGEWYADTIIEIENESSMFCVIPTSEDTSKFLKIGNFDFGSITNRSNTAILQAGRPFYVEKEDN